jgi:hypothetical protein
MLFRLPPYRTNIAAKMEVARPRAAFRGEGAPAPLLQKDATLAIVQVQVFDPPFLTALHREQ